MGGTNLLDLPPEILGQIGSLIVEQSGYQALDLCDVCPTFRQVIERALWQHPAFDDGNYDPPEALERSRMKPDFVRMLLNAKLDHGSAHQRPLTAAILAAKQFASRHTSTGVQQLSKDLDAHLITAITDTADPFQIARELEYTKARIMYSENECCRLVLIAAIYAGSNDTITSMIAAGAMDHAYNDAFGDPLRATVAKQDWDIFMAILGKWKRKDCSVKEDAIWRHHWMFALKRAAVAGCKRDDVGKQVDCGKESDGRKEEDGDDHDHDSSDEEEEGSVYWEEDIEEFEGWEEDERWKEAGGCEEAGGCKEVDGCKKWTRKLLDIERLTPHPWQIELALTASIEAGQFKRFKRLRKAYRDHAGWSEHKTIDYLCLETALRCDCEPITRFLIWWFADFYLMGYETHPILEDAVRLGRVNALNLILKHWDDALWYPADSMFCMFWAMRCGNDEVIGLLVDRIVKCGDSNSHELLAEAIAGAMDDAPIAEGQCRRLKHADKLNELFQRLQLDVQISKEDSFLEALAKVYLRYPRDNVPNIYGQIDSDSELPESGSVQTIAEHLSGLICISSFDCFYTYVQQFVLDIDHTPGYKEAWNDCVSRFALGDRLARAYLMLELYCDSATLNKYQATEGDLAALKVSFERSTTEQKDDLLRNVLEWGKDHYARWLLQNGVKPRTGSLDLTSMSVAIRACGSPMIQHLIDVGCEMKGGHLLHHAARRYNEQKAIFASEWVMAYQYQLDLAYQHQHESIYEMIIAGSVGRQLYAPRLHATALHVACHRSFKSLVALLLESKANVTIKDAEGRTPLDIVHDKPGLDCETELQWETELKMKPELEKLLRSYM